METMEEINARNKAIDEYNSRRNRLFGKAIYFASNVKIALDVASPDEHGDVKLFKDTFENLKTLAAEIAKDDADLQKEFKRIFMKADENG